MMVIIFINSWKGANKSALMEMSLVMQMDQSMSSLECEDTSTHTAILFLNSPVSHAPTVCSVLTREKKNVLKLQLPCQTSPDKPDYRFGFINSVVDSRLLEVTLPESQNINNGAEVVR